MPSDPIWKTVTGVFGKISSQPLGRVDSGNAIRLEEDLGFDEFDFVELLISLEEKFFIKIPDVDAKNFKTVGDVVAYIEKRKASFDVSAKQPLPHGTGADIASLVIAEIGEIYASSTIAPLLIADIETRVAAGENKYGERLRANNGRDALLDAYQKAIDLTLYLRQEVDEQGSGVAIGLYGDARALALEIRRMIFGKEGR
jgi:acyl carrier protein